MEYVRASQHRQRYSICKPTDLHVSAHMYTNMHVQKGRVGLELGALGTGLGRAGICMLSQDPEETTPSPRTFQRHSAGLARSPPISSRSRLGLREHQQLVLVWVARLQ
jgi:hypothetical protein